MLCVTVIQSFYPRSYEFLRFRTHLFDKVSQPGESEGTFSVFESSCYLLLPD